MASAAPKTAASLPLYTVVALCGFITEVLMRLLNGVAGGAKFGGRVVANAAVLPAFAAAGVIWELKDQLHHDKDSRTAVSTLMMQPSVLNWHDMPVPAAH
ncbi:hypothetical protein OEZ85_000747 [Tetradesmus obliquus]|uniref:Uncharacterized protein n=2 Tax=Tetradesmus obliquus TaxID=3088 RepID=A0ABY8UJ88_TETOB|nr:hypothetical protein OEZ85_000747 [Tetradesmus obliquus]|eukprot:jgi/Sobl393_1/12278/SZX75424.1